MMKRYFAIALITGVLLSVVIVDSMANFSIIPTADLNIDQKISLDQNSVLNPSGQLDDGTIVNPVSGVGNSTAMLSMLMVGLTLVGLAKFREKVEKREPINSEISPKRPEPQKKSFESGIV
jgi:hypothetical protein